MGENSFSISFDYCQRLGDEKYHYDYQSNSCRRGEQCGHYTQMIWESTRKVGCARVEQNFRDKGVYTARKEELWVCHYHPAGNWGTKTLLKLSKFSPISCLGTT